MDVRYINPFVAGIKNVFATMIALPFTLHKPSIKKNRMPDFEISCIIGLSGPVVGCVVISLKEKLALELASALTQETFESFDADAVDAIGEITNMIVGNAKSNFPEVDCSISVPSVVIGQHRVSFPSSVPIITIPCEIGSERLCIDVAIQKRD
jgi:chemotaxis protein CheX